MVGTADPAPEPEVAHVTDMDIDVSQPAAATQEVSLSGHAPTTDSGEHERRRVVLYRLDQPAISVWIRWRRFSLLLHDILEITAIRPIDLVAVHPLWSNP